jgi:membrane-anchored protein YejM (alkaline phosphatase superfamily)
MTPLHPAFFVVLAAVLLLALVWDVWTIRRDLARERRREQAR